MPDPLTLLLGGQMAAPRADYLKQHLTTDWCVTTWVEGEPFEDFADLVSNADAFVGGFIKGDWPAVPKLRLYQVPFTGYDWIGPEKLPGGCQLCNTFEHETTIAEYVMATMLEWEFRIGEADRKFRVDGWKGRKMGYGPTHGELYGKTVGIVGYGHIGQEVARRATAFGMRCIAVTRTIRSTEEPLAWIDTMDSLEKLLGESDYVLIGLPMSKETRGLFDSARLTQMKPDGVLINVGRGHIIDEESLYKALVDETIGGAVIDVWYGYPTPNNPERSPWNFPFNELDNIVMTPHNSALSDDMHDRRWRFIAGNLDRFSRGEPLHNICFEGTAA
ncbi:MAG: 2-hydroxyacid dehydrogenase [Rhodospirillaceae bacterium]|nr:2-hydroxyacid dehydrogenase [Rhodospirillaceae bacterium]MDD9929257.1 2-hydroxyacid dehydrogenase [Rhodospirillaceae bacterium]